MAQLQIGSLATQTGLTRATIRYYERIGILAPSARTPSGYRVYSEAARNELAFVRRAQGWGFTLEEIRELLHLHRRGVSPCERLVSAARRQLQNVSHEVAELTRFRDHLAQQIAQWTSCEAALEGPCALIECEDAACEVGPARPARGLSRVRGDGRVPT
jgi:DNA-binding transcriptional MerR regulator